ncbi:hypothetical protein [Falsiroseomonas sp.]|uniref:hypothetical protein n=1 Tax=Falsiroseomonas sp. TaxID=2870721 RepID=UPI003561B275
MSTTMAQPDDLDRALGYLRAMEERDLERAKGFLHPNFAMVFPGNRRMVDLAVLVAWSRTRYRFVRKSFDETDLGIDRHGRKVVMLSGRLSGEWLDGTAFAGIRYVDRFILQDGLLLEQHIWNDLAEAMHIAPR